MRLLIQRSPEPVPYRGAYFRISATGEEPARGSIVLPPGGDDPEGLALLLGLVVTLGDAPAGGTPIRQFWLGDDLRLEGKMGSEVASRHAEAAEWVAARIHSEWERFLGSAFARLRGEARGDAHFAFPGGAWDPERPGVRVTSWPPLPGAALPPLG